jgi:hypothetical protein
MTRLLLPALLLGCSPDPKGAGSADSAAPGEPFAEVFAQGGDRYLGAFSPKSEEVLDNGDVRLEWATGPDEPACLRGTPYKAGWRAGNGQDLVLFLQGGGACWSDFCFVIEEAGDRIPALDVFEPGLSPVAGWDTMYLPYCDGSLFAGDTEIDDDGDGSPDRIHRGLRNLSAALDAAHMRAPNPRRILVAGSSGGGFGTLLAPALVRRLWPGVPVDVVNDSGVGIAKPGDDSFVLGLLEEWNVVGLVPESCTDCISGGHLTGLVDWALREDPDLRAAAFSSTRDAVIAGIFLRVPGEQFEAALRTEADRLHAAHPDRFQPFIVEGDLHTALLGDIEGFIGDSDPDLVESIESFVTLGEMADIRVDGVSVADWLGHMVTDDPAWGPHVEADAR